MAAIEDVKVRVGVEGLQNLDKLKDKTEQAKTSVNNLATAILGVGFASFINGSLQAADRIADFSQATNISVASLKALEFAMNQAGGNGRNLERSINSLYAAIETANGGSLQARDAFAKVGVSLNDLRNASETDILQKTLEGLAAMPAGAERSAVATQLLSRSFRGIDPKQLLEALDTGKYKDAEDAIKKAADANQRLENTFKTLQEGAVKAIQPIVDLMGSKELTSDSAAKIITGLGIALGITFGASAAANILAVVGAITKFTTALKGTAAVQAAVTAMSGPKGIAMVAAGAVAAGAAIYGLNKLLEETATTGQEAANAVNNIPGAAPTPGQPGKIAAATPSTGAANRQQELDARQKAVKESDLRIAKARAEIEKISALEGTSDIEKIRVESAAAIRDAELEINNKTELSKAQKAKEFAAVRERIEADSAAKIRNIKESQEQQLFDQKLGYQNQIKALLGVEVTETQKVTDQIARQPDKYKEIGDQMRANAAEQDKELARVKEIIRLRELSKLQYDESIKGLKTATDVERQLHMIRLRASGASEYDIGLYQARIDASKKLEELEYSAAGAREAQMIEQGKIDELTQDQIKLAKQYNDLLPLRKQAIEDEYDATVLLLEEQKRLREDFSSGWEGALGKYKESVENNSKNSADLFNRTTQGMEDSIVKFAQTGKLSFKDLANSIIADIIRIQVRKAIVSFFGLFEDGGAFIGGVQRFAQGGVVNRPTMFPMANGMGLMGEAGPEAVMPLRRDRNGRLGVSASDGQGGGTNITYNIQAVDASSFRSLVARDPQFIYQVTEMGRRAQPTRRLA